MSLVLIKGSQVTVLKPDGAEPDPQPSGNTRQLGGASPLSLGPAVSAEAIVPNQYYAIDDGKGRLLGIDNPGAAEWSYATYVPYATYPDRIAPIFLGVNPTKTFNFSIHHRSAAGDEIWPMFPEDATNRCDVRWGRAKEASSFTLELPTVYPDRTTYNLRRTMADNSSSYLSRITQNPTDYAYFTPQPDSALHFSFHPFYMECAKLWLTIGKTWPNQTIYFKDYSSFIAGDRGYQVLTQALASQLWAETGLNADIHYTSESFDCDDFAYVYKAHASLYALKDRKPDGKSKMEFSLAVGIVFGEAVMVDKGKAERHAANVFLDFNGDMMIIDYGNIIPAAQWKYLPYFILM
jgi:hypothetical protein